MTPALINEWVTALRSGDYAQCKGALRKGYSFCCLGVLADIIGLEWMEGRPSFLVRDLNRPAHRSNRDTGLAQGDIIPERAAEHIGLRMNTQKHLSSMNDQEGCDFNEIATWIEQHGDSL